MYFYSFDWLAAFSIYTFITAALFRHYKLKEVHRFGEKNEWVTIKSDKKRGWGQPRPSRLPQPAKLFICIYSTDLVAFGVYPFITATLFRHYKLRRCTVLEKKTSESQLKAIKKWNEANREKANYTRGKSAAKSFIKNKATLEDLEMLEEVIHERRQSLK